MKRYAVVFEKTSTGWSAYAPICPGWAWPLPLWKKLKGLFARESNFISLDFAKTACQFPRLLLKLSRSPFQPESPDMPSQATLLHTRLLRAVVYPALYA